MRKRDESIEPRPVLPVMAICYDFDKTLSYTDMQAQGLIQALGAESVKAFWDESNADAKNHDMDMNLSWMNKIIQYAQGKIVVNRDTFVDYGKKVRLYPGVMEWFNRINKYGEEKGIIVEHYIISSGLKEMIEGTPIGQGVFKKIYASSYYYDNRNVPRWVSQVVNATTKTQFLFRIEKGVLDINCDEVNSSFKDSEVRVPFRNIVYIGDSATDIPCMKLVHDRSGFSIGVFDPDSLDKQKVYQMMREKRINFFAPADYSEGKKLDVLIKKIIDKVKAMEELSTISNENNLEVERIDENLTEEKVLLDNLINKLTESNCFDSTHSIVKKLKLHIDLFDNTQVIRVLDAALSNSQIKWILQDGDICSFYKQIIDKIPKDGPLVEDVLKLISK